MQWQTNGETYSEEWRNECEARDLLTWSLAARRKQLALIYEKRGEAGYYKLTQEIMRIWNLKQNKRPELPWYSSEELTTKKAAEVGCPSYAGEGWQQWRARISNKIKQLEEQA